MSNITIDEFFETCWTPCKKPHLSSWSRTRLTFFWSTPYLLCFLILIHFISLVIPHLLILPPPVLWLTPKSHVFGLQAPAALLLLLPIMLSWKILFILYVFKPKEMGSLRFYLTTTCTFCFLCSPFPFSARPRGYFQCRESQHFLSLIKAFFWILTTVILHAYNKSAPLQWTKGMRLLCLWSAFSLHPPLPL